ncbi:sugar phosphate isomerase [Alicyclobacillus cellulosilyticus]|uniref:Sugar phosphate isomerase n=1 Tax=Alicyclobacillus cellulosilyticus TaxID=1003997 RepID=A0A917NHM5_9BACL|nr:sugar phosphate isomerase/epimerase [Alicyclobacillus cellulosilyticus]GGJ01375.1 sugar phosphate isomerase [Alicyclobacillus cellulosilyticus]
MKLGLSTYSLYAALRQGEMTVFDVIDWTAAHGGEHVEIVPLGFSLDEDPGLPEAIAERAAQRGIVISNYAISANFLQPTAEAYEREVERVMREVDIARRLGASRMRHDVAWLPAEEGSIQRFEAELPRLVDACRRIADYAAQYGITTSVENHGYFVQASDRVLRLVSAVDRPNFRTTLDVGNFLCVDEPPLVAVQKNLPFASMVHLKDFYYRPGHRQPGEGWFPTAGGNWLRGAILGHGDLDIWGILKAIKSFGYDGYVSVEFEGLEDCRLGARLGLANARRIWEAV